MARRVDSFDVKQASPSLEIIDIRQSSLLDVVEELRQGLAAPQDTQKHIPTLLLYDEAGLRLFEKITYLDEYYLTGQEISILEKEAAQIADRIQHDSIIVELGSGVLRKVKLLLQALEDAGKRVDYYALDLDRSELERTLSDLPRNYRYIRPRGLHGTYDDGALWLQHPDRSHVPKCVLSLGSSIGNFTIDGCAAFVKQFADVLNPGDAMLLGIDSCRSQTRVMHAYADRDGVTHRFILNGLKHANLLLGHEAFDLDKWSVVDRVDEHGHYAYVTPSEDVIVEGVHVHKGELVFIEQSLKLSRQGVADIVQHACLVPGARWSNARGDYALHMASKPQICFPTKATEYAAQPVPSSQDFEQLWAVWDLVAKPGSIIPHDELLSKPINLRNACIFYLGHIPTFLDMQIAKETDGVATEPADYPRIFERGIDPDVDNPELVHAHSEIPDSWPPVTDILEYQERVRSRVRSLYASGVARTDRKLGRALWLGFEHEVMHLETLLYMLVQGERMLSPASIIKPDFKAMAQEAEVQAVPNEWFDIPAREITIGLDDPDNDEGPDRYFGWDNEKPLRRSHVGAFQAKARPITNGEFARYLEHTNQAKLPASWKEASPMTGDYPSNGIAESGVLRNDVNGHGGVQAETAESNEGPSLSFVRGKSVRTVFGAVPLQHALSWPVFASYDQLAGCAAWMGGRIPSQEEVQSIYTQVEELKATLSEDSTVNVPAVNGHLVNNGVEESPPLNDGPSNASSSGPDPHVQYVDLSAANVGFKHWHPTPITQYGAQLLGRGEMGGVWEWTSSQLTKHEGFEPMRLYPAYTADFFDGKHNVVLGGSWATHPRVAGRTSFVNWYQRNYPYAWAGARIVRDA